MSMVLPVKTLPTLSERALLVGWGKVLIQTQTTSDVAEKFVRYSTNNKYSVGLRMKIEGGEENVLFHS
jgi:hypothetical protein